TGPVRRHRQRVVELQTEMIAQYLIAVARRVRPCPESALVSADPWAIAASKKLSLEPRIVRGHDISILRQGAKDRRGWRGTDEIAVANMMHGHRLDGHRSTGVDQRRPRRRTAPLSDVAGLIERQVDDVAPASLTDGVLLSLGRNACRLEVYGPNQHRANPLECRRSPA